MNSNLIELLLSLNALTINLAKVKIKVVSLDHLITLKKIANRPQDRLDLKRLMKIKKIQKN